MSKLLPVCVGLLVVSGIVSVTLWQKLGQERQSHAESPTTLILPKSAGPAAVTPASTAPSVAETPPPIVVTSSAPISPVMEEKAKAVASSGLMSTDPAVVSATRLELLKDPEYRKTRLAQIRASQVENYPGVAEELGLSGGEVDKLFDVLAELTLASNMQSNALIASRPDELTSQRESARIDQESRRKRQEALTALLGPAKLTQWQQYQQTLSYRSSANAELTSMLSAAGQPATSAQLQPVVSTMAAEQKRQSDEVQALVRSGAAMDPQAQMKLQSELLARQEESNRRVLEAAAKSLNQAQVAALKNNMEQQVARLREMLSRQQAQQRAVQ